MRTILISLLAISALAALTSCDVRSDAKAQKKLAGVWVCEFTYPEGGDFKSTTKIAAKGDYVSQIIVHNRSNVVSSIELEGNMRIEGGVLIDVMAKHSNTNASLPFTNHQKIIRMTDSELVVLVDGINVGSASRESISRKIR